MIEKADEVEFWLEMVSEHVPPAARSAESLQDEAAQLRAIFVTSRMTVLQRLGKQTGEPGLREPIRNPEV